ncbi:MAG TPA: DUF5049 domain-containing protein [Halomicronema sp.]
MEESSNKENNRTIKRYPIPSAPGLARGEITLRAWGPNEWVTHFHNLEDNGYYFGHYFLDFEQAEADYEKRVNEYSKKEVDFQSERISNKVLVPLQVFEGLEAVRNAGTTNMGSISVVIIQAVALGYNETAKWITDNRELYLNGITEGFQPEH